jgi:LysM repeat protein
MAAQPHRSPARILAPLALVACAVAVLVIVIGSDGGGSSDSGQSAGSGGGGSSKSARRPVRKVPLRATYTVKTGDTLANIALKTGVTVERIQELNPELDPQALVSGQKIKLRE